MSENWRTFLVALRAIAFEFVSAVEELLEYPSDKRTSYLLKQAKRSA